MFHLAIPIHDIDKAKNFYQSLGLAIGRESDQFVIINFFGHQVVCHLDASEIVEKPKMYPRHFGWIVDDESNYKEILENARRNQIKFFKEDFRRYLNEPSEHRSFFLQDPSNNLIEFKWYKNRNWIF